jgi:hypothetical protein
MKPIVSRTMSVIVATSGNGLPRNFWGFLMKFFATAILLAAATGAGAVTVETTDFITTPTAQNGFEGLGATTSFDGTAGYTENGITVTYVGTPGRIWTTSQTAPEGLYSWYPDGGSVGYTRITFGGDVTAVEFRAGSGWFGGTINLAYDILLDGVSLATGIAGSVPNANSGFVFYGFSGATFDEVRLQAAPDLAAFDAGAYEALALDDIQIGDVTAGIPEPATWALMIAGFGLVGAAARRRRTAVTA